MTDEDLSPHLAESRALKAEGEALVRKLNNLLDDLEDEMARERTEADQWRQDNGDDE